MTASYFHRLHTFFLFFGFFRNLTTACIFLQRFAACPFPGFPSRFVGGAGSAGASNESSGAGATFALLRTDSFLEAAFSNSTTLNGEFPRLGSAISTQGEDHQLRRPNATLH